MKHRRGDQVTVTDRATGATVAGTIDGIGPRVVRIIDAQGKWHEFSRHTTNIAKGIMPKGYTYADTARRIAADLAGWDFWPAARHRRFSHACRVAGLDPVAVIAEANAAQEA